MCYFCMIKSDVVGPCKELVYRSRFHIVVAALIVSKKTHKLPRGIIVEASFDLDIANAAPAHVEKPAPLTKGKSQYAVTKHNIRGIYQR